MATLVTDPPKNAPEALAVAGSISVGLVLALLHVKGLPRHPVRARSGFLVPLLVYPSFYWSLDMALHGLEPVMQSWILLLNLGLPVATASLAFWCARLAGGAPGGALGSGGLTLLGIYLMGPSYMIASRLVERMAGVPLIDGLGGLLGGWPMLMTMFPLATFSLSAYDGTLPTPFLTMFAVTMAIRLEQGSGRDWRGWYQR